MKRIGLDLCLVLSSMILGISCGGNLWSQNGNPLYIQRSGVWSHTYFGVDGHGLGHECDNAPMDWNGSQYKSCFFCRFTDE
jgi:hypothetical protein